jgi:hypothetical protein
MSNGTNTALTGSLAAQLLLIWCEKLDIPAAPILLKLQEEEENVE